MGVTQIIIFKLDKQLFGIEINFVSGVNKVKDFNIVSIPASPAFIEGMINLRGKIIPLYNLRKRFEIENNSVGENDDLLIVNINKFMLGIIAEEVIDIVKIENENFEDVNDVFSRNTTSNFISKIAKKDDEMIFILDVEKILTVEEKDFILPIINEEN